MIDVDDVLDQTVFEDHDPQIEDHDPLIDDPENKDLRKSDDQVVEYLDLEIAQHPAHPLGLGRSRQRLILSQYLI